jgi:hypothetical protein
MSPPLDIENSSCGGCFLYETRGVCVAARAAYSIHTPIEIQERAEALRRAIVEDAHAARSFFELLRQDTERAERGLLARAAQPALQAAPLVPVEQRPEKEVVRVSRANQ